MGLGHNGVWDSAKVLPRRWTERYALGLLFASRGGGGAKKGDGAQLSPGVYFVAQPWTLGTAKKPLRVFRCKFLDFDVVNRVLFFLFLDLIFF